MPFEMYTPTEASQNLEAANTQLAFLGSIEIDAPEVLGSLRADVWPAYMETFRLVADTRTRGLPLPENLRATDATIHVTLASDRAVAWYWEALDNDLPFVQPLRNALDLWARRFSIDARWVLDAAIRTIRSWEAAGSRANLCRFLVRAITLETLPAERLTLHFTRPFAWNPTVLPRHLARRQILSEFTEHVDRYLDDAAMAARESGLVRMGRPTRFRHIQWAVQFQVKRETYTWIASESASRVSRRAVSQAVTPILDILDLQPRPARRRGRPRTAARG